MKPAAMPRLQTADAQLARFAEAAAHNLNMLTGQHKNLTRLVPLPPTATLAQVIERLNAITARMQGDA